MTDSRIKSFSFDEIPQDLRSRWQESLGAVLQSQEFIGGEFVTHFEESFAEYLGVNFVVGVGNGYDALFIALKALGVGPGHFVAVPNHTFIATWLAISATGAQPIGIDVDHCGLIDLQSLYRRREVISAVIPVHMHGNPVDMNDLMEWATPRKVKIIEDCAQAHGATINGRKVGTWGDIGAFSFYPTKNLGALGDAGAIATNDSCLARTVRSLANYGRVASNEFNLAGQGVNSRLDALQAAILSLHLTYLDSWNTLRKSWASKYLDLLFELNIPTIGYLKNSVFHHMICLSNNRNLTRKLFTSIGIELSSHYANSAQELFYNSNGLSNNIKYGYAEELNSKTLSLPLTPWMSQDSFDLISRALRRKDVRESILRKP